MYSGDLALKSQWCLMEKRLISDKGLIDFLVPVHHQTVFGDDSFSNLERKVHGSVPETSTERVHLDTILSASKALRLQISRNLMSVDQVQRAWEQYKMLTIVLDFASWMNSMDEDTSTERRLI